MPSSEVTSSSIVISTEGRFWVMTPSTLGEPGPLEVGEANPNVGVAADSVSCLDISGSSAKSLVDEKLPETSKMK